MKKGLSVLLVLALVFALAACASPDQGGSAPEGYAASGGFEGEIAYVSYFTSIPYWVDGLRGMEAAASVLGVDFDRTRNFYGPLDGSGIDQARVIDELVAKGVKGIIVSPADNDAIAAACKRAMDAGIPVVMVISGITDQSAYFAELGGSNFNVGVTGGEYIARELGGSGKVGILTIPGVPVHQERTAGYLETLAKYPGIEVVQPLVDTQAGPDEALARTIALIQANPDIKALIGTDSVGGAAAARAVIETGRVGDIIIIGMDRDQDLLGYIDDGVVTATVASKSFTTKWMAFHYVYWLINDYMEDVSDWRAANVDPVPRVTDTGNMLITQDNVHLFLE